MNLHSIQHSKLLFFKILSQNRSQWIWPLTSQIKSFYPGRQLCQQSQHSWDIFITRIRSVTVDSTIAPQNKELFCVLISVKTSGGRNISERRQLNCSSLQDETWAALTHHPSSLRYNAAALAPAEHCRHLCASLAATANSIADSSMSTHIHSCDSTGLPPDPKEAEVVEYIFQIGVNVSHPDCHYRLRLAEHYHRKLSLEAKYVVFTLSRASNSPASPSQPTLGRYAAFRILSTISWPSGWTADTWDHILSQVTLSMGKPALLT